MNHVNHSNPAYCVPDSKPDMCQSSPASDTDVPPATDAETANIACASPSHVGTVLNPGQFRGERIQKHPDNGLAKPGQYWKDEEGDWRCVTPNGLYGGLRRHHVEEHEDGTISVLPGEWGSNSILVTGMESSYHGYIRRGTWEECD